MKNPLNITKGLPIELRMLDNEFNNINSLICYDNNLYIGSDDGLTLIPINEINTKSNIPPKPFVENVMLNDENIGFSNRYVTFRGLNKLSVNFSSLNFSSLATIYSYKLEGYDDSWSEGNNLRAIYSNLPPGNYIFKLNAKKVGSNQINSTELKVIVKPTLMQRPVTWIALGAVLLFVISQLIFYYKNLQLKKKETERILLTLEHKALQSMMNPHFIFNALGSIQNYLLQNNAVEAGTYLSQFARLIRQNMNSIKTNIISVEEEIDRLRNYLDLERFRMNGKFDYQIEFDEDIEWDEICIPSMIVQPFVENAIWHGISPLQTNEGRIKVVFNNLNEDSIQIEIEDNGVGTKSSIEKSNAGQHLNLGMNLTQKRLELIGAKHNVKTFLSVEELFFGQVNPGTKVMILVPILKNGVA
jgi:hypothetical protein